MLRWLEAQPAPLIVAPPRSAAKSIGSTCRTTSLISSPGRGAGNPGSIADYRSEKDVQPMRLDGETRCITSGRSRRAMRTFATHRPLLEQCARAITHLGWGVDMVVADASVLSEEDAEKLAGRSLAADRGRLPQPAARPAHGHARRFESSATPRFSGARTSRKLPPVPPLSRFRLVSYLKGAEPPAMPFAAFTLLTPSADGMRPFDPVRNGMRVAAMLRHAAGAKTIAAALGWPDEKVRAA